MILRYAPNETWLNFISLAEYNYTVILDKISSLEEINSQYIVSYLCKKQADLGLCYYLKCLNEKRDSYCYNILFCFNDYCNYYLPYGVSYFFDTPSLLLKKYNGNELKEKLIESFQVRLNHLKHFKNLIKSKYEDQITTFT